MKPIRIDSEDISTVLIRPLAVRISPDNSGWSLHSGGMRIASWSGPDAETQARAAFDRICEAVLADWGEHPEAAKPMEEPADAGGGISDVRIPRKAIAEFVDRRDFDEALRLLQVLHSHAAHGTPPSDGTMRAVAEFLARVKEAT